MERLRRARGEQGFTLVELLVTIVILGIVMTGITSVVVSTLRTEQYQRELQDVVDDGRLSLTRIRQELRGARRVLESSQVASGQPSDRLHFWLDQNQDALVSPDEMICYVVEPVGDSGTQWQISRWAGAEEPEDCAPDALPAGQSPRVVASTLVNPDDPTQTPRPFTYVPEPGGINQPPTREIDIALDLEVVSTRGPESVAVEASIRLRNVP